ncbi:MAG: hypothetical protein WCV67_03100 [Victivallaceae bacterium]|jgi:hypothetical protein
MQSTAQLKGSYLAVRGLTFDEAAVGKLLNTYERRLLSKSGAFTRGVARRLVRFNARRDKHGAPGQPPVAHTRFFRDSIMFTLDPQTRSVICGPQKFKTANNNTAGQTVPEILEYGGNAAGGKNPAWPVAYPPNNASIMGLFAQYDFTIVRWGFSAADLIRQARAAGDYKSLKHAGKRGAYRTPGFYSPRKGRQVYLQFAPNQTAVQRQKSRDILLELFGQPYFGNAAVEPRPFMRPALDETVKNMPALMRQAELK